MGSIAALFMYLMIIGFIAVVAYFVIKKAIKDALKEYHNENNEYSGLLYTTCPEFGNHHSGVWVPLIPA